MTQVFTLVVPQWQGAAAGTGPYHGAQVMSGMIGPAGIDAVVPVREQSVAKRSEGVWYEDEISEHLASALGILKDSAPQRVLTIGGDCASDVGPISYLNKCHEGDVAVIWLDAHADLNTPQSSPSSKFHGMPLRLLLGDGAPSLLDQLPSVLDSDQVIFTGLRELDHAERQFIADHGLPNVPVCHECSDMLASVVRKSGHKQVYLHVDLDVIDPHDFDAVSCPSPGGFGYEDLLDSISQLGRSFPIVGCAITEYQPKGQEDAKKVERLLRVVTEAMLR